MIGKAAVASLSVLLVAGGTWAQEKPSSAPAAEVKASGDGLSVTSSDGRNQLRLGGYVQVDGRFLLGESGEGFTDTFSVRRIRPSLDVKVGDRFAFRFVPDYGEGKVLVQDAWFDVRIRKNVTFRAGKQKTPFGLEHLASDLVTFFAERGLPTGLMGARDVGFVLNGTFGGGRLETAVGILNGVVDGTTTDLAQTDGKELAARVFVKPFTRREGHLLKGLGFGFAATTGDQAGTLGTYRTPALQAFFSYAKGAVADGRRTRLSPQASYHGGPAAVLAEYVRSSPSVSLGLVKAQLDHEAWQVTTSVALTGEKASPSGLKPKRPLGSSAGSFGALEVVARYGQLRLDPATYSLGLASIQASASEVRSLGVGINWYVTRNVRGILNYEHSSFTGGAVSGDRPNDDAVTFRGLVAF